MSRSGTSPPPAGRRSARRRRFVAPLRQAVRPICFDAPVFDAVAHLKHWLTAPQWPDLAVMNAQFGSPRHPHSGAVLHFAAQTPALLADGLHYEQRIHATGAIATRECNWHDLMNALVWILYPGLKAALNVRQVADVSRMGPRARSRAQCALTHFDEAGAVVVLRDTRLLEAWDAHDWIGLFHTEAAAWGDGRAEVLVFGHALLEHALQPEPVHTAKCLVMLDPASPQSRAAAHARMREFPVHADGPAQRRVAAIRDCATAVAAGSVLSDPQELRPLPLSGIPGWHPRAGEVEFYRSGACFRPLRSGRRYPSPLGLTP